MKVDDVAAPVPRYLERVYWWAYVRPAAVKLFERQWLVNLILWGNFARLRDAALDALGARLDGRTLQLACVYGDLTDRLRRRLAPGGRIASESYHRVLLFFLLHEQPGEVRRRTLAEALRVLKPGGRLVIVDYHRPARAHPLYLPMAAILSSLEPFALDLWRQEVASWLPGGMAVEKRTLFGRLYQVLNLRKA